MATFTFFHAPMGGGKSLAALVRHHHTISKGLQAMLFVCKPRNEGQVHSRVGMSHPAYEIDPESNLLDIVLAQNEIKPITHIVADEAHFYSREQIEQLNQINLQLEIPVDAYGLMTDYRTRLFEGSQRLVELCDNVVLLPTQPLCSCGQLATLNARFINDEMVLEGEQILVGDIFDNDTRYEALCRKCHIASSPQGKSKTKSLTSK